MESGCAILVGIGAPWANERHAVSYFSSTAPPRLIFFVSDSKQHDILFSTAYAEFCRDEPALREIFQKARSVRELLFIDFVIVVAALVAEGGGGTCLFKYSVHAFVSFMLNVCCGF